MIVFKDLKVSKANESTKLYPSNHYLLSLFYKTDKQTNLDKIKLSNLIKEALKKDRAKLIDSTLKLDFNRSKLTVEFIDRVKINDVVRYYKNPNPDLLYPRAELKSDILYLVVAKHKAEVRLLGGYLASPNLCVVINAFRGKCHLVYDDKTISDPLYQDFHANRLYRLLDTLIPQELKLDV